jgi:formate hydrogenlyase subunit 6/NADH:ubiquinone oxidoreductase subunit I
LKAVIKGEAAGTEYLSTLSKAGVLPVDKLADWAKARYATLPHKASECIGCGACAKQCPVSAIERTDYIAPGKKLAAFAIDSAKCVKCGACVATCRFKAIKEG